MVERGPIRVAIFAANRADLSPLAPVVEALVAADDFDVVLLASGTMRNAAYGDPMGALDLSGVEVVWVAGDLDASGYDSITRGGARISEQMAAALASVRPAACLVLGDRWELLYAVPPVLLAGVPLVHLHGGEVTEGAIDDRIRHAVTKLADVHCVSTAQAAGRLRQMGEPAERIQITGAPGLDRMSAVEPADEETLAGLLGGPVRRPLALVTYHPPTAGGPPPGVGARAVLRAVTDVAGSVIITHPGLDAGREAVLAEIEEAVAASPHVVATPGLGAQYLPVLAAVDVMVGNSSSGVLEAASFGVPVVDVGDRQRGRARAANVLHAREDVEAITTAVRRCLEPEFRAQSRGVTNLYGDGHAAPRIVSAMRFAAAGGLGRKRFIDLDHPPGPGGVQSVERS